MVARAAAQPLGSDAADDDSTRAQEAERYISSLAQIDGAQSKQQIDAALVHACRGGHPPVVSALLTHGAGQDGFAALVDMMNEAGEKALELVDDGDRAAIAPLFGLG